MNEKYLDKVAELLLFAVNFSSGDKLSIRCDIDQRKAAHLLAQKAYFRGAAYVQIDYSDAKLQSFAISGSQDDYWFPEYFQNMYKEMTSPGWKLIGVYSGLDADVFENLDSEASSKYFKAFNKNREIRMKSIMANRIPWTLTYLPSQEMAKKAFPELDADKAVSEYWKAVIEIMGLDEADPVGWWKNQIAVMESRADFMNEFQADYLHFKGPSTDLKVGLCKEARWIGGYDQTIDGQKFMANIPTAEIFTSPDYRNIEGRVALTKPFVMHHNLGPVPEKAWFEFSQGRVINYGAEKGKESLDNFFKIDEGGKYLGEVALVDPQSPFAKKDIIYYNGLYDENAACHIALGKAYPFTLKNNKSDWEDSELNQLGLNTASVHEDMMIGGLDVDVYAINDSGDKKAIIKDGAFQI